MNTRTEIINALIQRFSFQSYLEIGIGSGLHFAAVRCALKWSVDPAAPGPGQAKASHAMTSDAFFAGCGRKFDLIFIDGLHEAETVYRDLHHALGCLEKGGMVVCHDLNPATEEMQRVPRCGDEWTGDCWRAWLRLREERGDMAMVVVDTDYGVGIIYPEGLSKTPALPRRKGMTGFDEFAVHKRDWLPMVHPSQLDGILTEWTDGEKQNRAMENRDLRAGRMEDYGGDGNRGFQTIRRRFAGPVAPFVPYGQERGGLPITCRALAEGERGVVTADEGHDMGRNPLWNYFQSNQGLRIHKWHHYFEAYHRHFARFRGKEVRILEIGVGGGGSLEMWRWYFGPTAWIYGVDSNPECRRFGSTRIEVRIGSQDDPAFLDRLRQDLGQVDILIDDGGHTMRQQRISFDRLFPMVSEDGVYLVEDLHTSYWPEYGGGLGREGTFIEFSKGLIDSLNAWHSPDAGQGADDFTRAVKGMHFYDSMLFIEKGRRLSPPRHSITGGREVEPAARS